MHSPFFSYLPSFKLIAVIGEKSAEFLQGQLTCDIREITETQTRFSAHCNPKGRVLSSFRICLFDGNFYLLAPSSMTALVISQLKKYAVFSKVALIENDEYKILGCAGETVPPLLQEIFGNLPTTSDQAVNIENALLIRMPGEIPRFQIICTKNFFEQLKEKHKNVQQTHANVWCHLDIQAGIAHIYPETIGLFTPHMLNYPALNAVSFKKGCYTGQEIIARTQYLGKSKRHLEKLVLDTDCLLKPGEMLPTAHQEISGIVVEAVLNNDQNQCEVLAVVNNPESS